MDAADKAIFKNDTILLSNVLFTPDGFRNQYDEAVTTIFYAGYNKDDPLRRFLPNFDLELWEKDRFETPQIGYIHIFGEALHRWQEVTVKLIYQRPSVLDSDSFDGILAILMNFERELPPEASETINPTRIIVGARWKITRLRSYRSPTSSDLCRVINHEF